MKDFVFYGVTEQDIDEADVLQDGFYRGLSAIQPLKSREAKEIFDELPGIGDDGASALNSLRKGSFDKFDNDLLSERGIEHIVNMETGGRVYYEQVYKGRPVWPGGASGVTIGVGYDLGYVTEAQFLSDWSSELSEEDVSDLARCVSKRRTVARDMIPRVRHIRIPFDDAVDVFLQTSLPQYISYTYDALEESRLDELHPHCRSALVSLVFNRGSDKFIRPGSRYREMRQIKAAIESAEYEKIPGLLRAMKRLWLGSSTPGVVRHREEEAKLFELGLSQMNEDSSLIARLTLDTLEADAFLIDQRPFRAARPSSRPRLNASDVYWPRSYINASDYRHLSEGYSGATFLLKVDGVNAALDALRAEVADTFNENIVLAIRGCRIANGSDFVEGVDEVELQEISPDHNNFRCLLGAYHTANNTISLYEGSTVPNAYSVAKYYNYMNGRGRTYLANCLPTGFYEYHIGSHYGAAGTIPDVLRQGDGPSTTDASTVTVLRSENDVVYGTQDDWDKSEPSDNIHPARREDGFSSAGCLTVKGDYSGGEHTGLWKEFQEKIGIKTASGTFQHYHVCLISGMELAEIQALGEQGSNIGWRLRHGSRGNEVSEIQRLIGVTPDGHFGPTTKEVLCDLQNSLLGYATGIVDQSMMETLGLGTEVS